MGQLTSGALRGFAFRGAGLLSCLGLTLVSGACICQDRIVYHPTRTIARTPADAGMPYEEVAFAAADGVRLSGWFVPAAGPRRGTLLFCHGNTGNISDPVESLAMYRSLGLDVLAFDYRGYGRSEGRPSEGGTYLDAEAAWRHLVEDRGVPSGSIVVLGRSLGGAIAAHLAAAHRPRALVVESAFCSAPDLCAQKVPWLPVRRLVRFDYATERYVGSVSCPVLVIHSPDDRLIPYGNGLRIFYAAPGPKQFLAIRGGHARGWFQSGERYVRGLARFLDACPDARPGAPPVATGRTGPAAHS